MAQPCRAVLWKYIVLNRVYLTSLSIQIGQKKSPIIYILIIYYKVQSGTSFVNYEPLIFENWYRASLVTTISQGTDVQSSARNIGNIEILNLQSKISFVTLFAYLTCPVIFHWGRLQWRLSSIFSKFSKLFWVLLDYTYNS
jgi:hypothetical protein